MPITGTFSRDQRNSLSNGERKTRGSRERIEYNDETHDFVTRLLTSSSLSGVPIMHVQLRAERRKEIQCFASLDKIKLVTVLRRDGRMYVRTSVSSVCVCV